MMWRPDRVVVNYSQQQAKASSGVIHVLGHPQKNIGIQIKKNGCCVSGKRADMPSPTEVRDTKDAAASPAPA